MVANPRHKDTVTQQLHVELATYSASLWVAQVPRSHVAELDMLAKRGLKSRLVQKPGLLLDVTNGQKESTAAACGSVTFNHSRAQKSV